MSYKRSFRTIAIIITVSLVLLVLGTPSLRRKFIPILDTTSIEQIDFKRPSQTLAFLDAIEKVEIYDDNGNLSAFRELAESIESRKLRLLKRKKCIKFQCLVYKFQNPDKKTKKQFPFYSKIKYLVVDAEGNLYYRLKKKIKKRITKRQVKLFGNYQIDFFSGDLSTLLQEYSLPIKLTVLDKSIFIEAISSDVINVILKVNFIEASNRSFHVYVAANSSTTTTDLAEDSDGDDKDLVIDNDDTGNGIIGDDPPPEVLCGDSKVAIAEECDDGNLNNLDGCSSLCVVEPGITITERVRKTYPESWNENISDYVVNNPSLSELGRFISCQGNNKSEILNVRYEKQTTVEDSVGSTSVDDAPISCLDEYKEAFKKSGIELKVLGEGAVDNSDLANLKLATSNNNFGEISDSPIYQSIMALAANKINLVNFQAKADFNTHYCYQYDEAEAIDHNIVINNPTGLDLCVNLIGPNLPEHRGEGSILLPANQNVSLALNDVIIKAGAENEVKCRNTLAELESNPFFKAGFQLTVEITDCDQRVLRNLSYKIYQSVVKVVSNAKGCNFSALIPKKIGGVAGLEDPLADLDIGESSWNLLEQLNTFQNNDISCEDPRKLNEKSGFCECPEGSELVNYQFDHDQNVNACLPESYQPVCKVEDDGESEEDPCKTVDANSHIVHSLDEDGNRDFADESECHCDEGYAFHSQQEVCMKLPENCPTVIDGVDQNYPEESMTEFKCKDRCPDPGMQANANSECVCPSGSYIDQNQKCSREPACEISEYKDWDPGTGKLECYPICGDDAIWKPGDTCECKDGFHPENNDCVANKVCPEGQVLNAEYKCEDKCQSGWSVVEDNGNSWSCCPGSSQLIDGQCVQPCVVDAYCPQTTVEETCDTYEGIEHCHCVEGEPDGTGLCIIYNDTCGEECIPEEVGSPDEGFEDNGEYADEFSGQRVNPSEESPPGANEGGSELSVHAGDAPSTGGGTGGGTGSNNSNQSPSSVQAFSTTKIASASAFSTGISGIPTRSTSISTVVSASLMQDFINDLSESLTTGERDYDQAEKLAKELGFDYWGELVSLKKQLTSGVSEVDNSELDRIVKGMYQFYKEYQDGEFPKGFGLAPDASIDKVIEAEPVQETSDVPPSNLADSLQDHINDLIAASKGESGAKNAWNEEFKDEHGFYLGDLIGVRKNYLDKGLAIPSGVEQQLVPAINRYNGVADTSSSEPVIPDPVVTNPIDIEPTRAVPNTSDASSMASKVRLPQLVPSVDQLTTEHLKRYMADIVSVSHKRTVKGEVDYPMLYDFAEKYGIDIDSIVAIRNAIYEKRVVIVGELSISSQTKFKSNLEQLLEGIEKFYAANAESEYLYANNIPSEYEVTVISDTKVNIDSDGYKKPNYYDATRKNKTSYMGLSATNHYYVVVPGRLLSKYPLGSLVKVTSVVNGVERSRHAIIGDVQPGASRFGEVSVALGYELGLTDGKSDSSITPESLVFEITNEKTTLFDPRINARVNVAQFLVTGNGNYITQN